MRKLAVLMFAVLALLVVGCPGSGWKRCDGYLWIYTGDGESDVMGFTTGARYRVIDTDPLTVEYEGWQGGADDVEGVTVAKRIKCD